QTKSSFDVREMMNGRKILLVNIPAGRLGEDASAMLGAMMVAKVQLAAMARSQGESRVPFYLYVDEFQNFVTSAFEKILAEARSFGLGLVVANQYEEQLHEYLQLALLKNVAVKLTCSFDRGRHRVVYQELQDEAVEPVALEPLPPPTGGRPELPILVREEARQVYGRAREGVESAIMERRSRFKKNGPVYYNGHQS
ncbi:MAG: hypothetical protein FJY85_20750, partial [Deltaproteobacteria bacterium]|nr:hypothetical protein [Deltaproteobacteria bacterium]